jgi:hypothetical protein
MRLFSTKNVSETFKVNIRTAQRWVKRKELSRYVVLEKGMYYFTEEALPILKYYATKAHKSGRPKEKPLNTNTEKISVNFVVIRKTSLNKLLEMNAKDVKSNLPIIYIQYKNQYGEQIESHYCNLDIDYPSGYNYVYLLENEGYVGITNNLRKRIGDHRRGGRNTNKIRLLGVYKNRIKAHFVETLFHLKGYKGYSGN